MKQEKIKRERTDGPLPPRRQKKNPVISNFEIYFQDFQMKKLGCDKCLQRENI